MRTKTFPCPVCKGVGDFQDGTFVDVEVGMVQVSAHSPCGYCEEKGMIDIDGPVHDRIKEDKMVELAFHNYMSRDENVVYGVDHDEKVRAKIKEIKQLFLAEPPVCLKSTCPCHSTPTTSQEGV